MDRCARWGVCEGGVRGGVRRNGLTFVRDLRPEALVVRDICHYLDAAVRERDLLEETKLNDK